MIVFLEEQHDLPLVDLAVVIPSGCADDPPGREGLARHAAELMRRGAGGRSRAALDEALDAIGATLEVETTWDAVTFTGRCLARHADALVGIVADVLGAPTFAEDEHEKLARETLALLDDVRDDDAALAARFFDRAALPGHPYGRTGLGTSASIAAITRDDAERWARDRLAQAGLIVGFAGDVAPAAARAHAARIASALPLRPRAPRRELPPVPQRRGRRTVLVDKPERTQSQILVGCAAPPYGSPDYLPLAVGAAVFGGTFTSRLMTEVRVKRGWSYGASCRIGRGRAGATTRIRVFPAAEQTRGTLALVLRMWERIAERGVTAKELAQVKAWMEGRWAFEIDTPEKRLERMIDALVMGAAPEEVPRFVERLRAVELGSVNDAIRRWWRPKDATIALTATAETMIRELRGLRLGKVEVVAFDSY